MAVIITVQRPRMEPIEIIFCACVHFADCEENIRRSMGTKIFFTKISTRLLETYPEVRNCLFISIIKYLSLVLVSMIRCVTFSFDVRKGTDHLRIPELGDYTYARD